MSIYFDVAVCRLCMISSEDVKLLKITQKLSEKIFECVSIEVLPKENSLLCNVCKDSIEHFYIFKEQCLDIDRKYKNTILPSGVGTMMEHSAVKVETTDMVMDIKVKIEEMDDEETQETHSNAIMYFDPSEDYYLIEIDKKPTIPNKTFQCDLCGKVVRKKCALQIHLNSHGRSKEFTCDICKKTFTRKGHIYMHMKRHLGIKPFICEICGKAHTRKQELLQHKTSHSDERKYSCQRCGKMFKRAKEVDEHMRVHTGERPHACKYCEKAYKGNSGLAKHYRLCHQDKIIKQEEQK